jgi:hypothetical protein
MKKVTKEEFYNKIAPLDVTTTVQGSYPYTVVFKTRMGQEIAGKAVDKYSDEKKYPIITEYYI